MENNNYVGKYGTFPWHDRPNDYDDIHPEDICVLAGISFWQTVLHCIGQEDGYLVLQFGDIVFRGKPENFHVVPQILKFNVNETVRVKNRDPEMIGTIYNVHWHFDRAAPIYFLQVNGKKKSRWYFEDEMEKCETSGEPHES